MPIFRLQFWLLLCVVAGLTTRCKKDDPQPQPEPTSQQLTTGSWRLDQIRQNGQFISGADIKDRYSLTFRADGTYIQKLLADNTSYKGTWLLTSNNNVLRITDHKGTTTDCASVNVSATELRYLLANKAGQVEERVFSAQP